MKTQYFVLAFIVISILAALITIGPAQNIQGEAIRTPTTIGFMTDLSGPAAAYGSEIQNGAKLAAAEHENINVVYEDTQCGGTTTISAYNTLTRQDITLTGGTVCSSAVLAIAPLLENTLHISTGASSPLISDAGENIYRLWPSDDLEATVLAEYASQELGLETASILYVESDFGAPLQKAFSKQFAGEILSTHAFSEQEQDFRTQLLRIRENSPQALYIISTPEQLPAIMRQAQELGIQSTLLSYGPAVEAAGVISAGGAAMEGLIYAFPQQEESSEFAQRYQEHYGKQPGLGASVGYDTMKLLIESQELCGQDINCVREYLNGIQQRAMASGTISFDENGDVRIPAAIKQVNDGQTQQVN